MLDVLRRERDCRHRHAGLVLGHGGEEEVFRPDFSLETLKLPLNKRLRKLSRAVLAEVKEDHGVVFLDRAQWRALPVGDEHRLEHLVIYLFFV